MIWFQAGFRGPTVPGRFGVSLNGRRGAARRSFPPPRAAELRLSSYIRTCVLNDVAEALCNLLQLLWGNFKQSEDRHRGSLNVEVQKLESDLPER